MKKFVKIAALMMIASCALMNTEKADAKTVSVNKTNVTVNVGGTTKVKVKNAKKVKVKISKKVAKVRVSGKTIKIKGIKAGKATVSVKASKMKTKKIKVTVKTKTKKTEASVRAKIDGYGDKYKGNIETYPYLDKKSYSKTSEIYRYSLNEQWKAMPDYLRDCLAYNKAKIYFDFDLDVEGMMYGYSKMKLKNYKDKYNENFSLIHEAAHAYVDHMNDYNIDVRRKVKSDYQNDPYKYGTYGGKSLEEFYAESIVNTILANLKTKRDSDVLNEYIDKIDEIKTINSGKTVMISIEDGEIRYSSHLDGVHYMNGMTESDFDEYLTNLLANHYKPMYPNADKIMVY